MILDADLSVAPEDLPQFYNALVSGKGEFINGSRLVCAKDPKAMRFLNLLGNKLCALLLTRLLGQAVKDTLCGTKSCIEAITSGLPRPRLFRGFRSFRRLRLVIRALPSKV